MSDQWLPSYYHLAESPGRSNPPVIVFGKPISDAHSLSYSGAQLVSHAPLAPSPGNVTGVTSLLKLMEDDLDSGYSGSPDYDDPWKRSVRSSPNHKIGAWPVENTSSNRAPVMKHEPRDDTDIYPSREALVLPHQSSRDTTTAPILTKSPAADVKTNSAANSWKASNKALSKRLRSPTYQFPHIPRQTKTRRVIFDKTSYSIEPATAATVRRKRWEAPVDDTASATENDIPELTSSETLLNNPTMRAASMSSQHQFDSTRAAGSNNEHQQYTSKTGVLRWVDATKDTSFFSSLTPPAIPNASISNRSSPAAPVQASRPGDASISSSRALVLEFWNILQDKDRDYDTCESWQTDESTECCTDDVHSPRMTTNGSGSNDSANSSVTSNSTPIGISSKDTLSLNKRNSGREDEEDERSNRKFNREQGPFVPDALQEPIYSGQMPCPMLELHDCQGTNTTISELMRSLMNRHRIVICKECCTRISLLDEEKKPVSVLQKHTSDGCERYCIGSSCASSADDTASYHRRTERCPSWATLTKEVRWTFIWTLVNPESNPPDPTFLPGPGFEHSQKRRPCKQQARARGNEICAHLMRDIEAKEGRISTLENDLTTAKNDSVQIQQRCDEKVVNLENIIENLLERLSENGVSIPGSLRKRLHNECPVVMTGTPAKDLQANTQALSTSALITKDRYYPGSPMSSNTRSMFYLAPPLPLSPHWSAAHQEAIVPNAEYGYPGFDQVTTANTTYPPYAFAPAWPPLGAEDVSIDAQKMGYAFADVSETAQPYKSS